MVLCFANELVNPKVVYAGASWIQKLADRAPLTIPNPLRFCEAGFADQLTLHFGHSPAMRVV